MDRQCDHLFIIHVHSEPYGTYGGYATPELISGIYDVEERKSKKILAFYGHRAEKLGVKFTLLKACSYNTGELICHAVDKFSINQVVTGRRDIGEFKRFFLGSTSKYLLENTGDCTVVVVKHPVGLEDEHLDIQTRIQVEEAERVYRIEDFDDKKALHERVADKAHEAKEKVNVAKDHVKDKLIQTFSLREQKQNLGEEK